VEEPTVTVFSADDMKPEVAGFGKFLHVLNSLRELELSVYEEHIGLWPELLCEDEVARLSFPPLNETFTGSLVLEK